MTYLLTILALHPVNSQVLDSYQTQNQAECLKFGASLVKNPQLWAESVVLTPQTTLNYVCTPITNEVSGSAE